MGIPVLVIGKSGAGKSASLRNVVGNENWNLVRVINKPLPFKGKINGWISDDYEMVKKCLAQKAKNCVVDDAGYLITNMFMKGHSNAGQGNALFSFYNNIGDRFWDLIMYVQNALPADKIVYFIMHEEKNDFGDVKAKTIGKLLDEKVCVEGMFTIVLRCSVIDGKHTFVTQSYENAISKSPIGMFNDLFMENDIALVEQGIREYYKEEFEEAAKAKASK